MKKKTEFSYFRIILSVHIFIAHDSKHDTHIFEAAMFATENIHGLDFFCGASK